MVKIFALLVAVGASQLLRGVIAGNSQGRYDHCDPQQSAKPSAKRSAKPSKLRSQIPTGKLPETVRPTFYQVKTVPPTRHLSADPTSSPTFVPTANPSSIPTAHLSSLPSLPPTSAPTSDPSSARSSNPTSIPTSDPTSAPTSDPTSAPTSNPTSEPTSAPTSDPTSAPTSEPTSNKPTAEPTSKPTAKPTSEPTAEPTSEPTTEPTLYPTLTPTADLTKQSDRPTTLPLYPLGVQINSVSVSDLAHYGCSVCYERTYATFTVSADINECTGPYLFVGGRETTSSSFILGAFDSSTVIHTQTPMNTPNLSNGVYWYFTAFKSFGFSRDATITQNAADNSSNDPESKLSWHLDLGDGGWRLGSILWLNNANEYMKVIYNCPLSVPTFKKPTAEPTSEPTAETTLEPTAEPTSEPTEPTSEPTAEPTSEPTAELTLVREVGV